MRFPLKDFFDYFKLDATVYSVEIYKTPLSLKEFLQLVEKFKYYCRKNDISWMLIYSTTDSKSAELITKRTGKRGRPCKTVKGNKIDGHIHSALIGNSSKSAYSTANIIKNSIDKKYNSRGIKCSKTVSKGNSYHAYEFIKYCMKQADIERTGGDFDFRAYVQYHNDFQ